MVLCFAQGFQNIEKSYFAILQYPDVIVPRKCRPAVIYQVFDHIMLYPVLSLP